MQDTFWTPWCAASLPTFKRTLLCDYSYFNLKQPNMSIVETNLAIELPASPPPTTTSDTKYTFSQATETQIVAQGTLLLDGIDVFDAKHDRAGLIKAVQDKMPQQQSNLPCYNYLTTMPYIIQCAYDLALRSHGLYRLN
jgi:hypothetical protein